MLKCMGFYQVFIELENKAHYTEKLSSKEDILELELYKTPLVVNGAFATEIAIKYLLFSKNIQYKKGHKLDYLYGLLDTDDKTLICEKVQLEIESSQCEDEPLEWWNKDNIEGAISLFSDNFNKWRYSYEGTLCWCDNIFRYFVHAVCKYVIKDNCVETVLLGTLK